ncbi:DUF6036 family nucleotidyltransferase [Rathayibacter iranicus]|uniref:DUF6036 domain-containing protein n=3 Tax=Rathayibacter iranicus TaxID=59737 RepID=A0AAD1ELH2_9MICO|nr:DUF6036 family nucleotidyltransferase [Rathayibacter iranicus]AZZ55036.1 hypothetical protein C7V51_03385 [Rathayibacter iranicus]MWV32242.1 hypothetical protein [Rathayibacter iranicus NCPPB 2253 = VKM Ac-1602]PPI61944.1 hypothetical protein C5E08_03395 [Rathayibacter iranicus]PWJ61529.1 hypothetical protein B0H03_1161 [Rathayibacter iranicus NCPPB 2253 = VKM Ac-1602]
MSADAGRLLTRDEILSLLEEVADRLDARGVGVDAYIIGGLAMAVQLDARRVTADVDGLFQPWEEVRAVAEDLAAERGLPADWLNRRAWSFMAFDVDGDHEATEVQIGKMRVRVASPRVLLAMKIAAGRRKDTDDITALIRHLEIHDPQQVVDIAFDIFGDESMTLTDSRESIFWQASEAIRQAWDAPVTARPESTSGPARRPLDSPAATGGQFTSRDHGEPETSL